MGETLTVADVAAYTDNRLSAEAPGNVETQRMLDAALARVRTFCGWHCSPVLQQTFNIDGSGYDWLTLPSLKLVQVISVKEDGITIPVEQFRIKTSEPGAIYWRDEYFNRCSEYEIVVNHGFTAAEAADWRDVVLQLIDATSLTMGSGGMGPLTGLEVDDVSLRFSGVMDRSWGIAKNPLLESVLYQYRILPIG